MLPAASDGLIIIAVETPKTVMRDSARQLLRAALQEVLAGYGLDADLIVTPGQAPQLANAPQIGLSLSHEPGLSLAAINFAGPVGIDLISLPAALPAAEIRQLTLDYLGPAASQRIGSNPHAFAEAWTQQEARLKCLGLGLTEWTPILEEGLSGCRCLRLDLPDGWIGTLALAA